MALSEWQQKAHEEAEKIRAEARRLKSEGYTVTAIAKRLNRSDQRVRDYLWESKPMLTLGSSLEVVTWEEKAYQMAAVYDDPKAKRWILEQMGVAERKR
jgi:predicted transcriptional regulator